MVGTGKGFNVSFSVVVVVAADVVACGMHFWCSSVLEAIWVIQGFWGTSRGGLGGGRQILIGFE